MPARNWAIVLLLVAAVLGGFWALRSRGTPGTLDVGSNPGQPSLKQDRETSVPADDPSSEAPTEPAKSVDDAQRPRLTAVKADASPQARSVAEAFKSGNAGSKVSILLPPQPFDAQAFEREPERYLNSIEPGRVFQTAQPGPQVPALTAEGDRFIRLAPGASTKLTVKAPPRAPVSFTSLDMGSFAESKLNSVTVRADEQGVATANFVASAGTTGDVNILAGSPLASGQVKYKVEIEGPELHPAPDAE
ncbi:MAG: hypothetical protein HS116_00245 [Planctomycetes bacterium]|nr:hypothetical protein [Planctomycetota bacterium]